MLSETSGLAQSTISPTTSPAQIVPATSPIQEPQSSDQENPTSVNEDDLVLQEPDIDPTIVESIKRDDIPVQVSDMVPVVSEPVNTIKEITEETNHQPDAAPSTASADASSEYLVVPYEVPADSLPTFLTRFMLNGQPIDHQTNHNALVGGQFGDGLKLDIEYRGSQVLSSQLEQSITTGNVLRVTHTMSVLQGQSVLQDHELTITERTPQLTIGERIQTTLTANCVLPGTDSNQVCSYTPGLNTDNNSLDADFLLPTQLIQMSDFGEVVTEESLAAIRQPGFQQGANGQSIGLDLYFPNAGSFPSNQNGRSSSIERMESFDRVPALGYAQVKQLIHANAHEASFSRTIRNPLVIFDDEQPVWNGLAAILALILPEFQSDVEPTAAAVNSNLNQNLFIAANNTWLPPQGLTLYQTGIGVAPTPQVALEDIAELPQAQYHTLWLGLSPVTERDYSQRSYLETVGQSRPLSSGGAEGGSNDENVSFISVVNDLPFSTDNLENTYTQIYLSVFEQDTNRVDQLRQTERVTYHPHLVFSGNQTGPYSVLRYYLGMITADQVKPYVGLDYARETPSGLSYKVGGVGYLNPDYDYYSQLFGSLNQQITLSESNSILLGTAFNWAIDQDTSRGDIEEVAQGSSVVAQAQLNMGNVSLGATHLFEDLLPNSSSSKTVVNLAWDISNQLKLSGFWTVRDNAISSNRLGASLSWQFAEGPLTPTLVFTWNNTRFNYGEDFFGKEVRTSDDAFGIFLKLGF